MYRTEPTARKERAILVGVILPGSDVDTHDPLGELRSLVRTAGATVAYEMTARRDRIHPGLYVGAGKAEQIADLADAAEADVVVFDTDLSPAQIRDLENIVGRRVLDRSEVILDIFAAHARTSEAKLQVELAQLEYTYPRLRHMWSHLERIAGGASSAAAAVGGIGTRGPGEKQIEIDRRLVRKRVTELKRRITEIDKRKQRIVRNRRGNFLICLVGYTNAGKSTMMNLLTGAGVGVADQLFATLDTRTRRWNLGDGQIALLSDTVGFISRLPHHLIASFRATFEEAIGADLLLHVADASAPRVEQQIQAVDSVLDELGCNRKDQLLLFNKTDRITDPTIRKVLSGKHPGAIFTSAATGENADAVVEAVLMKIQGRWVSVTIEADCANGRLMQYLARHARTTVKTYLDSSVRMEATIGEKHLAELNAFGKDVKILTGIGN
ncbi:MAG: GTPase HflX [Planctomycetota bacterium]|nr:GTPase HflX [Planctomycetota bacterium]